MSSIHHKQRQLFIGVFADLWSRSRRECNTEVLMSFLLFAIILEVCHWPQTMQPDCSTFLIKRKKNHIAGDSFSYRWTTADCVFFPEEALRYKYIYIRVRQRSPDLWPALEWNSNGKKAREERSNRIKLLTLTSIINVRIKWVRECSSSSSAGSRDPLGRNSFG